MTAAFPVRGTLLGSLLVILASGAQIESNVFAATIEAPLTGPTTTINFNSLSVTGSTPAGTVNVGGDAFSATSPSEAFILAGYSATGNNQIFSTDNGSSFTTPDSLTIAPAAGVTEIGLTYGTFNLFGVGAFTPLTISATVNTVSGSPTSFVLPNLTTGVEEVVDFVSTSAITSIVHRAWHLKGLLRNRLKLTWLALRRTPLLRPRFLGAWRCLELDFSDYWVLQGCDERRDSCGHERCPAFSRRSILHFQPRVARVGRGS